MKKFFTLAALLLMQNSYALELEGINGVEILAINGIKVESSIFTQNEIPQLDPGKHQVVVRYSKEFYEGQELRSRPSIFTIDIQQDTQITVDKFKNENAAQRAINHGLDWNIISKDKQYTVQDSHVLIANGMFPYSDIEDVVFRYNQKNNISTMTTMGSAGEKAINKKTMSALSSNGDQKVIQGLYNKLSIEDKKQFRMWLIEQDMK